MITFARFITALRAKRGHNSSRTCNQKVTLSVQGVTIVPMHTGMVLANATQKKAQAGTENGWMAVPLAPLHSVIYFKSCLHRCMDSKCFELLVFPLSSGTSTAKREM